MIGCINFSEFVFVALKIFDKPLNLQGVTLGTVLAKLLCDTSEYESQVNLPLSVPHKQRFPTCTNAKVEKEHCGTRNTISSDSIRGVVTVLEACQCT